MKKIKEILLRETKKERKSKYKNDFNKIINGFDLKYNNLKKQKNSIHAYLDENKKLTVKGLYVIFIENTAIYVGISKNIRKRIMQHVNGTHSSTSTLAYKLAKIIFENKNGEIYKGTKKDFFKNNLSLIIDVKKTLKDLNISTIEIEDNDELALFEIYCSMKFPTYINTFETH